MRVNINLPSLPSPRCKPFLMIYQNGWPLVLGYFNVIKVLSQFSRQAALEPSSNSLLYPFLHFPIEILPLMLAPVIASCHGPAELLRGDWNIFKYCCSNFYVAPWLYHQKTWNLSLFRFCFVPCLPGSPQYSGKLRKVRKSQNFIETPRIVN